MQLAALPMQFSLGCSSSTVSSFTQGRWLPLNAVEDACSEVNESMPNSDLLLLLLRRRNRNHRIEP